MQVLNRATIGELLEAKRLTATKPPSVLPEDTLIEIASVMDAGHTPVILVIDRDGAYHGVITLSRVLAAIATAAGQDSLLVRRRLERDVLPKGRLAPERSRPSPCTVTSGVPGSLVGGSCRRRRKRMPPPRTPA